jgi:hypothetical protein
MRTSQLRRPHHAAGAYGHASAPPAGKVDADHVILGVDDQLHRGLGVADGVGHQLSDHLRDVLDECPGPSGGDRLGRKPSGFAGRERSGGKSGDKAVL